MSRRLLDTNLIVRHLVQDHPMHAEVAGRLFERCDRGLLNLVILPTVLAECVFVLESFYAKPRADIARVLANLVSSPGIEVAGTSVCLDALSRYSASGAHFVDCTLAAQAAASGLSVATFDKHFKRFPDVRVELD